MTNQWKICCICVEKSLFVESITENDQNNVKYIDKLKLCIPTEDWFNELEVCNGCIERLDSSYEFIKICQKSEEYRKEQLRLKEKTKAILRDENKCGICFKTFKLKRTLALHNTRVHIKKKAKKEQTESIDKKSENTIKSEYEVRTELVMCKEEYGENENHIQEVLSTEENDCNSSSDEDRKINVRNLKRSRRKQKLPQKCEYCDMVFDRTDKYTSHVRSKHTLERPYKCDLCPAEYFTSHNLSIHKRKHTSEKPYVCSTCGKRFASSNDLWQHNKTHNATREYSCDQCDRSFKTNSNLRTHKIQMHLDPSEWKYICSTCGKKFPLKSNLIKHMRRHTGIKSFLCHLCSKGFVEKIDLQTHIMSHSDIRLFKCNLCIKEYKKKETLRRHLKVEHNVGNMKIIKPEKKLFCPMCPKVFAFNNKLQRHILTHTGERPISCDYCEKRFRDNYDRNFHMRKEHELEIGE